MDLLFGDGFQLTELLFAVFILHPAEKLGMQHIAAAKPLQGIQPGALNEVCYIFNRLEGNNRFDSGGPEFIINPGRHEDSDAIQDGIGTVTGFDISTIKHWIGF